MAARMNHGTRERGRVGCAGCLKRRGARVTMAARMNHGMREQGRVGVLAI